MLTPKEERLLKHLRSKTMTFGLWVLALSVPFNITIGIIRLHLCRTWASLEGQAIKDVFNYWLKGINPNETYTGTHLLAEQQLITGLSQFGLALILGIAFFGLYQQRKMMIPLLMRFQSEGA